MADDSEFEMYNVKTLAIQLKMKNERLNKENEELIKELRKCKDRELELKQLDRMDRLKEVWGSALQSLDDEKAHSQFEEEDEIHPVNTALNNLLLSQEQSQIDMLDIKKQLANIREILRQLAPTSPQLEEHREVIECKRLPRIEAKKNILVLGASRRNEVAVLNQDKSAWIQIKMKEMRALVMPGGGAVCLYGEIYCVGGHSNWKNLHKLDEKSMKLKRLADMNVGRTAITNSCLELNGYIWVFGGKDENEEVLQSVEQYNPMKDKWTRLPEMKYHRYGAAVVQYEGAIIVCGGIGRGNQALASVECYDSSSAVWTELSDLPKPMHRHSLVSYYGSKLLVISEASILFAKSLLDTNGKWEVFPTKTSLDGQWCDYSTSSVVFYEKIFSIGGRDPTGRELGCVYKFDGKTWGTGPSLPFVCFQPNCVIIPQDLADLLCQHFNNTQ